MDIALSVCLSLSLSLYLSPSPPLPPLSLSSPSLSFYLSLSLPLSLSLSLLYFFRALFFSLTSTMRLEEKKIRFALRRGTEVRLGGRNRRRGRTRSSAPHVSCCVVLQSAYPSPCGNSLIFFVSVQSASLW